MQPVSARYDPQQEAQNAANVSFELEVVSRKVDRFGWDRLDERIRNRLSDDWTDVLRAFPLAEVRRGIADCLSENPKSCPNEYAVLAKIQKRRANALARVPKEYTLVEPVNRDISPEAREHRAMVARKIMAEIAGRKSDATS